MRILFQRIMAILYAVFAGLWGYLLIHSGIWAMSTVSSTDSGMTTEYAVTFPSAFLFLTSGLVVGLAIWLLLFSFKKAAPLLSPLDKDVI